MADKNIKLRLDYSEFTGGIKECKSEMAILNEQFKLQKAELGNNATELDKLTLAEDALNNKILLQEQIAAKALDKWEAMANSEDTTAEQVKKAQKAYLEQATALEKLRNEHSQTVDAIQELEDAESSASSTTESASSSFASFADNMMSVVGTVSSVASAISGAVSAISNVSRSAASMADDIATSATKYGVATETMARWKATAELTDVSAETLGSSMSKLTLQMANAANGSSEAQEKFSKLNIAFQDSGGNLRNTESVFYEIIDALGGIENVAERDAQAMQLLGKSAQDLNPIIEMGSSAFQEMQQSAQNVISEGMADNLNRVSDSFAKFDTAVEYGNAVLVNMFAPAISSTLDTISGFDSGVLAMISALKLAFEVFTSLAPAIQTFATMKTAAATASLVSAGASTADTGAKTMEAGATEAATAANVGFVASLVMAAPAIAELLLSAAALVASLAAVAYAISMIVNAVATLAQAIERIIELFKADKEATDAATDSALRYSSARQGLSTVSSSSSGSTSYMATGSTVGGAGGLTWVGEQGAELVNLPSGSTVYNHEESTSMATANNVNNYYVTIDAKNVTDFNKVVSVFSGLEQSFNRGGFVNG